MSLIYFGYNVFNLNLLGIKIEKKNIFKDKVILVTGGTGSFETT